MSIVTLYADSNQTGINRVDLIYLMGYYLEKYCIKGFKSVNRSCIHGKGQEIVFLDYYSSVFVYS